MCPKCGAPIAGSDIDLGQGLGVCRPCGELVPLPPSATARGHGASVVDPPAALYRPEGFAIVEVTTESGYLAEIRPSRLAAIPQVFFTLFWDGFMAVWYFIAISTRVWIMAGFGILHLGVGVVMTHGVLVKLFNTTRLRIEGGRVRFSSGPIPTRGSVDLPVDAIDSFSVGSRVETTRRSERTVHFLDANLAAGTKKELKLDVDDYPSIDYAAARFNEALANAKRRVPHGPYRD